MCAPDGLLGDIDVILWPRQSGTRAYAGFNVLPPFIAHSVNFVSDQERKNFLDAYDARLHKIQTEPPIFFHPLADFGPDWRLKPDVPSRTVGQRRTC